MSGTSTRTSTPPRPVRSRATVAATVAVTLGVLAGVTGGTAAVATERRGPAAAEREGVAALARSMDAAVAAGVPGLLVRVDDGSGPARTLVRQSAASAAVVRLQAHDTFKMGSNTKTLTAVLVLQLVDEGRLGLDDPIERWLPGAVPDGGGITVRMLLNHTSGLADYAYDPTVLATMAGLVEDPPTDEQLLAVGTGQPLLFPPGTGWSYSNSGYSALGLLLEEVTDQSLSELVQERVAGPLGMRRTSLPSPGDGGQADRRLADGYEPDAAGLAPLLPPGTPEGFGFVGPVVGGLVDVTDIDQSWGGAAGGALSTAEDWARFDRALMAGELVPPHLLAEMTATVDQEGPATEGRRYGLGLEQVSTPCGTVWGHDGALPGYRSDTYTDGTGTRTMTVLTTTHFGLVVDPVLGVAQERVLDAAVCLMLGRPVPHAG